MKGSTGTASPPKRERSRQAWHRAPVLTCLIASVVYFGFDLMRHLAHHAPELGLRRPGYHVLMRDAGVTMWQR